MGVNVGLARSQANKMRDYASDLRDIRNSMKDFRANLNYLWQAEEMIYINNAIDKIDMEILHLYNLIDSLGDDIISVAYEIKREEEEREAAARAAAAAAAASKISTNK